MNRFRFIAINHRRSALRWMLLAAFAMALVLRCPHLDRRPMHNDEAVNAVKFGALWEQGIWKYDPNEHHGPTLAFATLVLSRLTGAPDFAHFTENRLRMVTVLFGAGLILLLPLLTDGVGRAAAGWAAILIAVSPAAVFYSRYYIHEMLLAFFTLMALGAGWRYWRSRKPVWAMLTGAALGLMQATKETSVLTFAAMAFALALNSVWNGWLEPGTRNPEPGARSAQRRMFRVQYRWLAAALGTWLLVAVTLFSSFFTNANGPLDALRTYGAWLHRVGGNSPHMHPWTFYLGRLAFFHRAGGPVWTEGLILALAATGFVAALRRKGLADANAGFVRFLAFYTGALTAIYSGIAYKTPWCLLSFWSGMILLAGVGAVVLLRAPRRSWARVAVGALLTAGTAHLAWQAWQADAPDTTDRRNPFRGNPYVYAQTSPDLANLIERVEALALAHPAGHDMVIKVIAPEAEYWPLPWSLRAFRNVGWWGEIPPDPFAPVMIVATDLNARLDERRTHVMAGLTELRPAVFLELYVQAELWRAYLASPQAPAAATSQPAQIR